MEGFERFRETKAMLVYLTLSKDAGFVVYGGQADSSKHRHDPKVTEVTDVASKDPRLSGA